MIKGGAYSLPASALKDLAQDDEVVFIHPDRPLRSADSLTDAAIGMAVARNLGLGKWGMGIGVAVIDSGINDGHYDLRNTYTQSRVSYHQDFTGTTVYDASGRLVYDTYGHGTHVAGILAGDGTDDGGQGSDTTGIAYGVNLIDLRVLDQNGVGTDSAVIAAIQRAIALKNVYNIRVINLSLGRPVYGSYASDPLCQAVEQAWAAGITVVVAAGNLGRQSVNGSNGYGTVMAPGNDPFVITVGAMKTGNTGSRSDDQIASYSSKGPTLYDHVVKPDIVAPGNLIKSTIAPGSALANQYPSSIVKRLTGNYDYFVLSGTSMAAPVVSGTVAMLLQQDPNLTPDQIKARLMKTAYKTFPASSVSTDLTTGQTYTSYYDLFTVGAGYLDIAAAVANTDKAPTTLGSALSPSAVYNSITSTVSLVNGNSVIWGGSVAWGSSVTWGTSVVWGTNVSGSAVLWGTSVAWGSSTNTGFSVVWGGSTTCASSVVWGSSNLPSGENFLEQ
ncbi:MAG TPA: S8 family peptidase [Candidatus Angelobacter sp.]